MSNKKANSLIHETSPYLLQHAYNPVNWMPWAAPSLEKAKQDKLLMIISIGYSACHWCHVMEKESFEDPSVAGLMNKDYVAIKVDREERPDVDQVYMQACYAVTGNGGWPLNVIALPDGRPVYAGTYFPKDKWTQLLDYFAELYRSQPDLLERQANEITHEMQSYLDIPLNEGKEKVEEKDIRQIYNGILSRIDMENGGLSGAPKFPMPAVFEFLLNYNEAYQDETALEAVFNTLDHMAAGGIYDQLGGGFFRYSTDRNWLVPHFEKMLYDNAQLISLYSHAYMISNKPLYARVIKQSILFIENTFSHEEGGFYAAMDADSEGEEGKYYTWKISELSDISNKDYSWFCNYYRISETGNWEDGKNILHYTPGAEEHEGLKKIKATLLELRNKKTPPALDTKILTSWNALMINALLDAYKALGEEAYLNRALKNARFIESNMLTRNHKLYRNYSNGEAGINGFLDDYAFLANAFLNLYQINLDEHWAYLSLELSKNAIKNFYDEQNKRFYYNSIEDPDLIIRPSESDDNVIPSSTAMMVKNLGILSKYFGLSGFEHIRDSVLDSMLSTTIGKPVFHSFWAQELLQEYRSTKEIVIIGEHAHTLNKELQRHYLPGIFTFGAKKEGTFFNFGYKYIAGKTLIYVCVNKSCHAPVETVGEALNILRELRS